ARSGMVVWAIGAVAGLVLVSRNSFGWGIWLMLISVMMFQGAKATLDRERIFASLAQGTVNDAMGPPPETIPEAIPLSEALDGYLRGHETETFPVTNGYQPMVGVLTFDAAAKVGSENPLRPVRDAMLPPSGVLQVGLHDRLDAVAGRLAAA